MLIPNHPEDERLSALAFGDTDATGDASLTDHVATCARCTETLDELGALRASLASMPDLRPSRPLQLVPGVVDSDVTADRVGGWVRRLFAPMLTAGAALALVGVVGTASPVFEDMASGPNAVAPEEMAAPASEAERSGTDGDAAGGAAPGAAEQSDAADEDAALEFSASPETGDVAGDGGDASTLADAESQSPTPEAAEAPDEAAGEDEDVEALTGLPAERSLWPMVLFTGVALIVLAVLLRWVLAPRAG